MSDDTTRDLLRLIDERIALSRGDGSIGAVRGTITAVNAQQRTCAATLDGSRAPTQGITIPAGIMPEVGDAALIAKRSDGFLFLLQRIFSDDLVTGSIRPATDAGGGELDPKSIGSIERKFDEVYARNILQDTYSDDIWGSDAIASHRRRRAGGTGWDAIKADASGLQPNAEDSWEAWDGEAWRVGVKAEYWTNSGQGDYTANGTGQVLWSVKGAGNVNPSSILGMTADGEVVLHQNQLVFANYSGNPSTDAETLDDYEEGTWSPYWSAGASASMTIQTGHYTKIGRLVTVTFDMTGSRASMGPATALRLDGLPFTATTGYGGIRCSYWGAISASAYGIGALINSGQGGGIMYHSTPGTAATALVGGSINTAAGQSRMIGFGQYMAA